MPRRKNCAVCFAWMEFCFWDFWEKIRVSDKVRECLSVVLFLAAPAFALGAIETLHDNSVAQMKIFICISELFFNLDSFCDFIFFH